MHGIIVLNNINVGVPFTCAQTHDDKPPSNQQPSNIGAVLRGYKSLVSKACLLQFKKASQNLNPVPHMGKIWQRNYYDHIIRNEESYHKIANYIINNPINWKQDKFYQ